MNSRDGSTELMIFAIFAMLIYLIPSFIAYSRRHAYRHVILGINIVGGVTGLGWIVAFAWAIWPANRSLADAVIGNPTGKGVQNVGDSIGSAVYGIERGYKMESGKGLSPPVLNALAMPISEVESQLRGLKKLVDEGFLTSEEYEKKRGELLGFGVGGNVAVGEGNCPAPTSPSVQRLVAIEGIRGHVVRIYGDRCELDVKGTTISFKSLEDVKKYLGATRN